MNSETEQGYLLDVNVLIALTWPQHIHHFRARSWWRGIIRWATTPFTEAGFVRLSTNAAAIDGSVSPAVAIQALTQLRGAPGHFFLVDDTSLASPGVDLGRLATSKQVTDAHLVNLAASNDLVLATLDRGIPQLLSPADRRHVLVLPDPSAS